MDSGDLGTILIIGVVIAVAVAAALMIRRNPKYRVPPSAPREIRIHNPRPRTGVSQTGSRSSHAPIITRTARRPDSYWDADRRRRSDSGLDPVLITHFPSSDDAPHSGGHHSDHSSHDGGGYDSGGDSGGGSDGGGGDGGGGGD